MRLPVGDDYTTEDWEWIGPDGLTDIQRSEREKISPDLADKTETAALP
jgi:hypothetical protein